MYSSLLCLLLLSVVVMLTDSSHHHAQQVKLKYRHFDEYLLHLSLRDQVIIVEEVEAFEIGSNLFEKPLPIRSGVRHNKDEKCCMLGHLAGEKGFHCVSRFYATRLLHRNYNRAHNKKVVSLHKGKPYADKLMRTFEQCVVNHRGYVFHKCCRHAAMQ